MQLEKIGSFDDSIKYIRKICKRYKFHSDTMYFKLCERYEIDVAKKAYAYFMKSTYYNDKIYLDNIKELCKKRHYSINRYKKYCKAKHIRISNINNYSLEEEKSVFYHYVELLETQYKNYIDSSKKILCKLNSKGFPYSYYINYRGGINYD